MKRVKVTITSKSFRDENKVADRADQFKRTARVLFGVTDVDIKQAFGTAVLSMAIADDHLENLDAYVYGGLNAASGPFVFTVKD